MKKGLSCREAFTNELTNLGSLALGALESIQNQITGCVELMTANVGKLDSLCADGGPTRNAFLMQLQADLAGVPVARSLDAEISVMGAAHLAGLGPGWWDWKTFEALKHPEDVYSPRMPAERRTAMRGRWKEVLGKARGKR